MKDHVVKYGDERVHKAGMDALGYPPAWSHAAKEFKAVTKELEKRK